MDAREAAATLETAMNLAQLAQRLAQMVVPDTLLVRHASDEDERQHEQQAVERAHRVVKQWDEATRMQAALIWERRFWERHGPHDDG